ncbi:MAG: 1,5-anhydro-D-fructose reductase [Lentisphaerae bacterium ADurb.Bin242]|nr:MAG: 1,5-anhydro-D-fructose reductase [Lentisphaerae bacterium ADurb.Bin242]
MAPFRIGLYGCGGRTVQILEKAVKEGRAEVALCFDIRQENAERLAKKYGGRVSSKQELMESKECDMLLISLFPAAHPGALLETCGCGKPVYIEKPVAVTLDEVRKLIPLLGKGYVHVGCSYGYYPVFRTVENLLAEGRIGKIIGIHIDDMGNTNFSDPIYHGPAANWRGRPESGGELTQHGTHKFEFLRRLAGNFKTLTAMKIQSAENTTCMEDVWNLIFTQGEDTLTSIHHSLRNCIFTQVGYAEGMEGTLRWEWNNPSSVTLYPKTYSAQSGIPVPLVKNVGPEDQLDDFITRFKTGLPPAVDLEDGLWSVLPPIYARESVRSGTVQKFPDSLKDIG